MLLLDITFVWELPGHAPIELPTRRLPAYRHVSRAYLCQTCGDVWAWLRAYSGGNPGPYSATISHCPRCPPQGRLSLPGLIPPHCAEEIAMLPARYLPEYIIRLADNVLELVQQKEHAHD